MDEKFMAKWEDVSHDIIQFKQFSDALGAMWELMEDADGFRLTESAAAALWLASEVRHHAEKIEAVTKELVRVGKVNDEVRIAAIKAANTGAEA